MFRSRNRGIVSFIVLVSALWTTQAVTQTSGSSLILPAATIGTGYQVQISTDGMELAMPFTVDVGNLPAGLTYNPASKIISGTPAAAADAAQTYVISVVVKDANKKTTSLNANLVLNAATLASAPAGQDIELPDAFVGLPYNVGLSLPVGASTALSIPLLPTGLAISPAGVIAGVPAATNPSDGEYYAGVAVTPAGGGAVVNERVKLNLHLSPPILKIYAPCSVSLDKPPTITTTLSDLSSTISGLATVPGGCTAKIAVWTIDPAMNGSQDLNYLTNRPTRAALQAAHANSVSVKTGQDTVASDGTFSVQLTNSPRGGQTMVLEERLSDSSQNELWSIFSDSIPVHFAGDWGRVKTYFTSGILLSEDQGSFSQSSLFLSFLLDKAWVLPGPVYGKSRERPGFNTFFETRLTSVPVTAQPCPTASSTTSGQCTNQSGSDVFNTFLTSQKTARLLVGAYFPVVAKSWTFSGVRNALFIAPLAKVGFDTPTSPINQSQAQGQSASAGNSPGTVIVPVNNSSFYNFYAYGFRFGHAALPAPEKERNSPNWAVSEAPELNSYLDVAWGRFSNLETILDNGNHVRLYRFSLEGLLKIPSTPLAIGFSANLGQEDVGINSANVKQKAADDLRFLIGAKFDVGKITSYLTAHAF
jgi:Putative Ig domain